ncbi:MAG: MaoC/PaaZ C-terminal domain-containing protein [Spongiibacteraceae bacterium]|jgi:acyl dehydratase|nr:MaoC/PaaZ C-terminal domain-containing protein [Spongiibacteraceae bacterium]
MLQESPQLLYFEDLTPEMRLVSPAYSVGEAEIIEFAKRWDPQPFHTDREQAKDSEFGRLVACGMHVNAIRGLLYHRLSPKPLMAMGLGANQTLLLCPVEPDDELVLTVCFKTLRRSRSRPHLGVVVADHALHNQQGMVVMTLEAVTMVPLRHP